MRERRRPPFDLSQVAGGSVQVNVYDSTPRGADAPIVTLNQLCEETGMSMPSGVDARERQNSG